MSVREDQAATGPEDTPQERLAKRPEAAGGGAQEAGATQGHESHGSCKHI